MTAPNDLPFTGTDYLTVDAYRPRFVSAGANLSIADDNSDGEVGFIAEPGSRPKAIDWIFWRETNGIHAERLADKATFVATDMVDFLDGVLGEWAVVGERRAELAARWSRPGSLPDGPSRRWKGRRDHLRRPEGRR